MSMEIAHIAVAVKDLHEALLAVNQVLGLKGSAEEVVPDQKVKLQFVTVGGVKFEFLEPITSDSPISKFLDKRGNGIHHIAIYVDDLRAKLKELKEANVPLIDQEPRLGADHCEVAFLHPKAVAGILVELIQKKS